MDDLRATESPEPLDVRDNIKDNTIQRKSLKDKIDDIIVWIDLDDDDTKLLMQEKTTGNTVTQEIVIPAFDIHNTVFGFSNGEDRITTTVYEIRTSPQHTATLKSIQCNTSHSDNHHTVKFVPYEIQGITNKYIYKTMIKKKCIHQR